MAVEEKQKEYIIRSFYDILQALREHPDWAEQLLSLLLTEELLKLPQKFDKFVEEEFRPLAKRVERLEEGQKALVERVERLEEGQKALIERVERLEEGQKRLEEGQSRLEKDVAILKNKVSKLEVDVAKLKGDNLERKVRERAPAYFGRYFRRVKAVPIEEWSEKLEDALDGGLISEEERKDALNLDALIRVKSEDGRNLLLAVEVSHTLEDKDADRALRRANVIARVYGIETIPVVIGAYVPEGLQDRHPKVLVVQVSDDN